VEYHRASLYLNPALAIYSTHLFYLERRYWNM
jgi:hypothetical protein